MKKKDKAVILPLVMERYEKLLPYIMRLSKDNKFYASFVYNLRCSDKETHLEIVKALLTYVYDTLCMNQSKYLIVSKVNYKGNNIFRICDVINDVRLLTFALYMKVMEYSNLDLNNYREVMKMIYDKLLTGTFLSLKYRLMASKALTQYSYG